MLSVSWYNLTEQFSKLLEVYIQFLKLEVQRIHCIGKYPSSNGEFLIPRQPSEVRINVVNNNRVKVPRGVAVNRGHVVQVFLSCLQVNNLNAAKR